MYLSFPVVRTDGRCTVKRLPNFLGWVDLLTHGAPQARFVRQSSAIKKANHRQKMARMNKGLEVDDSLQLLVLKTC